MQGNAEKLWQFAVAIYEIEAVKAACLRIQARYGLSISLVLGAIWLGAKGHGRMGATDMEDAIRRAMEWHREVIEPMRALRRKLRQQPPKGIEDDTHELRRELLESELKAERIEQELFLLDFPEGLPVAAEGQHWRDAAVNSALLTRKHCPLPEPEALDALAQIISAACPGTPFPEMYEVLESVWKVS